MKLTYILSSAFLLTLLLSSQLSSQRVIDEQIRLGASKPTHYIDDLDAEKIKQGELLIKKGWAFLPNGKKSKVISKHFVCTSCHNLKQEDPDLRESNPEKRLIYAEEHKIPLLQGTTLYGTVNRKHWYNEDYAQKYGNLVIPAADTMTNAIQLCAEVCSQGRVLEDWELEAITQYLWTIDLKTDDLPSQNYSSLEELNSLFLDASPATFVNENKEDFENLVGNPINGGTVYRLSCMHCHQGKKQVSLVKLKYDKHTLNKFKKNLYKDTPFDLLQIVRNGTKPHETHKPYMPHYTAERLSKQQLADLIAFVSKF
jgi:mono/diheme cytochrome c family protein